MMSTREDLAKTHGRSFTTHGEYQNKTHTSVYKTSSSRFQTAMAMSRSQEKEELQRISDRLMAYIDKVRQYRERSSMEGTMSFQQSTKSLEEEVSNLKFLYEKELDNVRTQLETCKKECISYQMKFDKGQQLAVDIEKRFQAEEEKNRKLVSELQKVRIRITQLEHELVESRELPKQIQEDSQRLVKDIEKLTSENQTLRMRYEKELALRKEMEEKALQLSKKIKFNEAIQQKQMTELKSRLENSMATILTMEAERKNAMTKSETPITELLKQVREAAEAEIKKYQTESEVEFSRNITSLKAQLDNDAKSMERCNAENSQLRDTVLSLRAKITTLEGQVKNLEFQKFSLDTLLRQERTASAEKLQAMEVKLREIQDLMVVKMRDGSTRREVNIPLNAEIEALKLLLEEEEKMLTASMSMTSFEESTQRNQGGTRMITWMNVDYRDPEDKPYHSKAYVISGTDARSVTAPVGHYFHEQAINYAPPDELTTFHDLDMDHAPPGKMTFDRRETLYTQTQNRQHLPDLTSQNYQTGGRASKEMDATGRPRQGEIESSKVYKIPKSKTMALDSSIDRHYVTMEEKKNMTGSPRYAGNSLNIKSDGTLANKQSGTIHVGPNSLFLPSLEQKQSMSSRYPYYANESK